VPDKTFDFVCVFSFKIISTYMIFLTKAQISSEKNKSKKL